VGRENFHRMSFGGGYKKSLWDDCTSHHPTSTNSSTTSTCQVVVKKKYYFLQRLYSPLAVGRTDALASLAAATAPDRAAHHPRPRRGVVSLVRRERAPQGRARPIRVHSDRVRHLWRRGAAHSPTSTHEHGRSTSNKFWEGRRVPAVVCVVRRRVAPHRQDLAGFSLDAGGHASSLDSVDALLRSAISRASSGDPAAAQAPTSCSAREPLPTRTLSSTRVCSRQSGFCSCLWLLLARPPLRRIFMCSPPGGSYGAAGSSHRPARHSGARRGAHSTWMQKTRTRVRGISV